MIFSVSYLFRFLCDILLLPNLYEANKPCPRKESWEIVDLIIVNICDSYIFDFLPIATIFLFHYRNFKIRPVKIEIDVDSIDIEFDDLDGDSELHTSITDSSE